MFHGQPYRCLRGIGGGQLGTLLNYSILPYTTIYCILIYYNIAYDMMIFYPWGYIPCVFGDRRAPLPHSLKHGKQPRQKRRRHCLLRREKCYMGDCQNYCRFWGPLN